MKIGSTIAIEGVGKLLNDYFYSTSYTYDGVNVSNKNGVCTNIKVKHKKGRYYVEIIF